MRRSTMWGMCLLLVLPGAAHPQVESRSPSAAESSSENVASAQGVLAPRVEEIKPPLFYLEDATGKLRPAFGFKLEEFLEAYKQMHGLQPEARCPQYVLKKITATGEARENHAKLTFHCDILFQRDGMIRIPLLLGRAVITGDPEYSGEGLPVLAFERTSRGYVGWIKGKAGRQHRLTLKTLVPLVVVGDKTTLQLRIPSATESELKLTVPVAGAVAKASEGAMLKVVPSTDEEKTELTIWGLRGDAELAWHKPEVRWATVPTVLEAVGEILVQIDSQAVRCEAALRVRGHGKPFDRFRVRLPAGTRLVSSNASGYSIVETTGKTVSADQGRVVEVQLREKTQGPVTVHLAARRALDRSMFGRSIELAGFAILGAARQSGHLAVEVADDLDVLWNPQLGVQQVEDLPDSLLHDDLLAGFKYSTQPCSLLVRVAPRRTRMTVEPRYVLLVDANQVQLEATLKYSVRGKKARVLDVDLSGWQVDEVEPDNLVAVDQVVQSDSGNLSIPLRQPSSGKIELRLKAHRRVEAEKGLLRLTLPRPKVATPSPATVVIVPEDSVQLTIDSKATKGLVRQQVAPPMPLPKRQQTPLFYRGDPTKAVLVARREVHAQEISVNSTTTVLLDEHAGQVRQKLSYKIDYEPQDSLALAVPRELADSENLEFFIQGRRVLTTDLSRSGPEDESNGNHRVRIQIALDTPRIGMCNLEVRYPLDPHQLVPRSSIRRTIGLVVPTDGKLIANRLLVTASPELQLSMMEGPWKKQTGATASASVTSAGRSFSEFVADGRVGQVEFGVCLEARQTPRATVIRRALVQTWLSRHARQDRAVFRFSTHKKTLHVVLPQETSVSDTVVYLNGKLIETHPAGKQMIRFDLPEEMPRRQWLLEVHSQSSSPRVLRGRWRLELPRLGEDTWVRRLYWQLTLPKNEHIVSTPAGLVREFRWGWNGLFWGREALLQTADLETWIGVPEHPELADGNDSYLFSAFGRCDALELVIVSRSWIVLGASGAALVLGLLLIYVRATRHPATLLGLAVVLGCTGWLYPEPTLLVLQAASLGLVLIVMAGLLERGAARRRRGLITLETSGSAIEKDSTQTQFRLAGATGGSSSTAALQRKPASDKTSSVIGRPDVEK